MNAEHIIADLLNERRNITSKEILQLDAYITYLTNEASDGEKIQFSAMLCYAAKSMTLPNFFAGGPSGALISLNEHFKHLVSPLLDNVNFESETESYSEDISVDHEDEEHLVPILVP